MRNLLLVLLAAALLFACIFLSGSGHAEASGFSYYLCLHNGLPYTVISVPSGSPPFCPEQDPAWNPVWDQHEGIDCTKQKPTGPCIRTRHIDCEYGSEPEDI